MRTNGEKIVFLSIALNFFCLFLNQVSKIIFYTEIHEKLFHIHVTFYLCIPMQNEHLHYEIKPKFIFINSVLFLIVTFNRRDDPDVPLESRN